MRSEKDEKLLFLQACQKAGLKVHSVSSGHPASGLIIRDAHGHRFVVNEELEIVQVRSVRKNVGMHHGSEPSGRHTQAVFAQRDRKIDSRQGRSQVKKAQGKVKAK